MALTVHDAETLSRCIAVGGIAVFPADTVYGLACDPDDREAVQRLYMLKRRRPDKPAAVMFFALDLALAALPELKKKRKIFFVNDWLGAFVGGQVDAQALEQVASFASQPDLDPDLKLQLLEVMDGLARTVKIRARFAPVS